MFDDWTLTNPFEHKYIRNHHLDWHIVPWSDWSTPSDTLVTARLFHPVTAASRPKDVFLAILGHPRVNIMQGVLSLVLRNGGGDPPPGI